MGRPQKRVSCRAKASERLRISASVARIVAQYAVVFHVIFWFTTGGRADDDVVDRSTPVPVVVVIVLVRLLDTVLTDLDRRRGEHVDGQHFAVLLLVVVVVILAIL
jgi:Ca2+/Na+ antiporter